MENKEIHVAIIGQAAIGKTTIAQLVKEALAKNGFKNVVHITDEVDLLPEALRPKRIKAVAEKCSGIKIIEVNAKPKLKHFNEVVN